MIGTTRQYIQIERFICIVLQLTNSNKLFTIRTGCELFLFKMRITRLLLIIVVTCCVPTNKKHLRSMLPVNQVELSLNTNSFQKPKKKVVTWSLPLLSKITRVERTSTYSFLSFLHSFLPSTSFTLHLLCAVDSASTPQ